MSNNKVLRLCVNSMLAALCAVLGYVSIDVTNLKVTFESFPILMGALLFGPVDGAAIAFVGEFLYQVLRYGVTATTMLWILPYLVFALLVGWYGKKSGLELTRRQTIAVTLLGELTVFILNTAVMYIDSKIYGYYSFVYIFGTFLPRMVLCIGKSVVFGVVLYPLLGAVRRSLKV